MQQRIHQSPSKSRPWPGTNVARSSISLPFVSPGVFSKLVKWGWVDFAGRTKRWFDWQSENHNNKFEEPRERKSKSKKFVKRKKEEPR